MVDLLPAAKDFSGTKNLRSWKRICCGAIRTRGNIESLFSLCDAPSRKRSVGEAVKGMEDKVMGSKKAKVSDGVFEEETASLGGPDRQAL